MRVDQSAQHFYSEFCARMAGAALRPERGAFQGARRGLRMWLPRRAAAPATAAAAGLTELAARAAAKARLPGLQAAPVPPTGSLIKTHDGDWAR